MEEVNIWPRRVCPFCNNRMYALHQRDTVNKQTGMEYVKTETVCPPCDYWEVTKIPKKLAEKVPVSAVS